MTLAALIVAASLAGAGAPPRIFVAGDSTAAQTSAARRPQQGWGAYLGCSLGGPAQVLDLAVSGRSSRSYVEEGRLARLSAQLQPGDLLLIEFGRNDAKPDPALRTQAGAQFEAYLARYVEAARGRGARPVLMTPIARLAFRHGAVAETLKPYAASTRKLARRLGVPVVDADALSRSWLSHLGPTGGRRFYMILPPGAYPGYPLGANDDTHLTEAGAKAVAGLVARELVRQRLWPSVAPPQACSGPLSTGAQSSRS